MGNLKKIKQKMKFTKLITYGKLLIIIATLATSTLSLKLESNSNNNLRATNITANSTAPVTKYSQLPESSATGSMKNESRVLSTPFVVTSCDQVIEIAGNTLLDMNDYSKKAPKFFTLSTYLVNQFEKKDSATLTDSIGVEKITTLPQIIQGSVSCIGFYANSNNQKIIMCLDTAAAAQGLITAFGQFSKCRAGGSIGGNTNNIIKILETSCLGLKIKPDPKIWNMSKDPQGKKIQAAISMALLNISSAMRDENKKKLSK